MTVALLMGASEGLTISGPSEAKVGQTVRVTVSGLPKFATMEDLYAFSLKVEMDKGPGCECVLEQTLAYDLTRQSWKLMLDFQAEMPGTYVLIVVDCRTCTVLNHRVVVGGTPPQPDPEPDPEPDPNPGPTPTDFVGKVKAAFNTVPLDYQKKGVEIGQNYQAVAAQAAATPSSWTPATMLDAVKARHSTTLSVAEMKAWAPFWSPLAQAFLSLKMDASDLDAHIKAFHIVAETLNDLATLGTTRR